MMTSAEISAFREVLNKLVGQLCWSVQAGNIGSLASLQFGNKLPLDKPLPFPNPALTEDEHRYRGEFVLYIEDCPWRLDGTERVLATWLDSNAPDGPMVTYMKSRLGAIVTEVDITYPGLDLFLRFNDNIMLRIFPDQVDPSEGDNYSLQYNHQTFVIAANSTLYIE